MNATAKDLLELCFTLQDHAHILPYYFYMCDIIPNSEHWRTSVAEAQQLQHDIMGYLPGFATPRIVCDVPFVGKRWVHQVAEYDREQGISYWTKNYRTGIELDGPVRARAPLRVLRPGVHAARVRPGVVAPAGPGLIEAPERTDAGPRTGAASSPRRARSSGATGAGRCATPSARSSSSRDWSP